MAQLSVSDAGWSVDNSQPVHALTLMKGASAGPVLGLTRATSRIALGLDGRLLQAVGSGRECILPRVRVQLSYQPIVIYIGSEFAPGSCPYEAILAHEMRHLKAYLQHLPKVETSLRDALEARFGTAALVAPAGQARALLAAEMDKRWMPYIKNSMAEVEAQQAAIDSPQEYLRLSKVCQGEVQFLLRPQH